MLKNLKLSFLEWSENSPKEMIEIFRNIKKNYPGIVGFNSKAQEVPNLPEKDQMEMHDLFNRLKGANVGLNTVCWTPLRDLGASTRVRTLVFAIGLANFK